MDWRKIIEPTFGLLAGPGLAGGWLVAGFAKAPHVNFTAPAFPLVIEIGIWTVVIGLIAVGSDG